MSGKELIIYILENDLLDEPVYKDGRFLGFMTALEAAAKFDVGETTIKAMFNLDLLPGVEIGNDLYIPANAKSPIAEGGTNV